MTNQNNFYNIISMSVPLPDKINRGFLTSIASVYHTNYFKLSADLVLERMNTYNLLNYYILENY